MAIADQGGMGLPDRDYYVREDAKSIELRKQYEEHVGKPFYEPLVEFMLSGPVVAAIFEGHRVIETTERFLRDIADRIGLDAVDEVRLFPPLRQSGVETGVAVVAALPLPPHRRGTPLHNGLRSSPRAP